MRNAVICAVLASLAFIPLAIADDDFCPAWNPACPCDPIDPLCPPPWPVPTPTLDRLTIEYLDAAKTTASVRGRVSNWRPGADYFAIYAAQSCSAPAGRRLLGYTWPAFLPPGEVHGYVSGLQPGELVIGEGNTQCALVETPTRLYSSQPSSAPSAGGATIVLTGISFHSDVTVWFDYVRIEKTLVSDSRIEIVTPAFRPGTARLRVHDPYHQPSGRTTEVPFEFTCTPAQIVSSSPDATLKAGESTTLQVQTTGAVLKYEWFSDNDGRGFRRVDGATASSLKVTPEATTHYRVEVHDDCGVKSRSMNVAVLAPAPRLRGLVPDGGHVSGGTRVSISGMNFTRRTLVRIGSVPITPKYWSSRLIEITTPPHAAGPVNVEVHHPFERGPVQRFTYETCTRPRILVAPDDVSLWRGATAMLSVKGQGQSPLAYQWNSERDGAFVKIDGATATELEVIAMQSTSYQVLLRNACGTKAASARVNVCDVGTIAVDGTMLTLVPDGPVLAVQWLKGEEPIEGATELQHVADEPNTYTAQVTTPCGVYEVRVDVTPSG